MSYFRPLCHLFDIPFFYIERRTLLLGYSVGTAATATHCKFRTLLVQYAVHDGEHIRALLFAVFT